MSPLTITVGDKIASFGLAVPAIFLLESCKPLSSFVRHAQETTEVLHPHQFLRSLMHIFSDRTQLEELIQYLERKAEA